MNNSNILVISSNKNIIFKIKSSLDSIGLHNIDYTQNSDEAIESLNSNTYQIIITESNISPISGLSIIAMIREGFFSLNSAPKIIGLTSNFNSYDTKEKQKIFNVDHILLHSDIRNISKEIELLLTESNKPNKLESIAVIKGNDIECQDIYDSIEEKFNTTYYQDGQDLISDLDQGKFDIIFMPDETIGISGVDLVLKAKERNGDAMIAILSENKNVYFAKDLLNNGASEVITGPFSNKKILETTERLISIKKIKVSESKDFGNAQDSKNIEMGSIIFNLSNELVIEHISPSWNQYATIRIEELLGEKFTSLISESSKREKFLEQIKLTENGSLKKIFLKTDIYFSPKNEQKTAYLIFFKTESGLAGSIIMDSEIINERKTLELLATHDHKTGLLNSYSFKIMIQELQEKISDEQHTIQFIHIDGMRNYLKDNGLLKTEELMMRIGLILKSKNNAIEDSYRLFGCLYAKVNPYKNIVEDDSEHMKILSDMRSLLSRHNEKLRLDSCCIKIDGQSGPLLIDNAVKSLISI